MNKLSLKKRNSHTRHRKIIAVFSVVVILCTGLLVTFWVLGNNSADEQPVKLAKANLDEKKPTKKEKSSYQVAPDMPRALYINKIGVKEARILPMRLEKDGALAAPSSIHDVGWYEASAKPGEGGALLMDGHVSGIGNKKGIFYDLKKLVAGDEVIIEKGDHTKISYRVKEMEVLPVEKVDMIKAMRSIEPGVEGLNLITCGGDYDYRRQIYEDRIVVYAVKKE